MDHPGIDVAALARLARIEGTPDMTGRLTEQLPRIIEYVGQLHTVTVETVPVMPTGSLLRTDAVESASDEQRRRILDQAPDRQDDFWKVKAVL
jgi:aspartyl/glutamyl-tRNA(Asn/Gln) amidotransferase C subunit